MLPKEMLSDEVKMGEVDPKLWIALEDLYDGWEKAGQVGQEVYGAGNAFGILPRHCFILKEKRFRIFSEYPVINFKEGKRKTATLRTGGSQQLFFRLLILKQEGVRLPQMTVQTESGDSIPGRRTNKGNIEYSVRGGERITISWTR